MASQNNALDSESDCELHDADFGLPETTAPSPPSSVLEGVTLDDRGLRAASPERSRRGTFRTTRVERETITDTYTITVGKHEGPLEIGPESRVNLTINVTPEGGTDMLQQIQRQLRPEDRHILDPLIAQRINLGELPIRQEMPGATSEEEETDLTKSPGSDRGSVDSGNDEERGTAVAPFAAEGDVEEAGVQRDGGRREVQVCREINESGDYVITIKTVRRRVVEVQHNIWKVLVNSALLFLTAALIVALLIVLLVSSGLAGEQSPGGKKSGGGGSHTHEDGDGD